MKLYDSKLAPNPRRVRIFAAEKGIQLPRRFQLNQGRRRAQ
jgi:glutathione S-transferase